jgi:uncharacterized damage-inducible protein DinB
MIEALQTQYTLAQRSRDLVFDFIESAVGNDLNTPVPAFQNQTIRHLLVHNADCYLYWLDYMSLELPVQWLKYNDYESIADIRRLYLKEDDMMAAFLKKFENSMDLPINNARARQEKLNATPLMIFTHVITHEFHHKGQIMSMCRQLGYPPPETDIYKLFYQPTT